MLHPALGAGTPFDVRTSAHGTTMTVAVTGEVDLAVVDRISTALDAALAAAPETVVVDLGAVSFIDSTGLRALVAAHRHARARDVRMIILPAPARVQRIFAICGLDEALPFAARLSRTA